MSDKQFGSESHQFYQTHLEESITLTFEYIEDLNNARHAGNIVLPVSVMDACDGLFASLVKMQNMVNKRSSTDAAETYDQVAKELTESINSFRSTCRDFLGLKEHTQNMAQLGLVSKDVAKAIDLREAASRSGEPPSK